MSFFDLELFVSVVVGCFGYGSKLRNTRYVLKIKSQVVDVVDECLSYLLRFITNAGASGFGSGVTTLRGRKRKVEEDDEDDLGEEDIDDEDEDGQLLDVQQIVKQNETKFEKLCVATTFMQILLHPELYGAWNLDVLETVMVDEFILRLWFCLDNTVINFKLRGPNDAPDSDDENVEDLGDDDQLESQMLHKIRNMGNITEMFDKLYSSLLTSVVDFAILSGEFKHTDLAMKKCKELINWTLLTKFPKLQVALAGCLMKLLLKLYKDDNLCLFWSQLGISCEVASFIDTLCSKGDVHFDLIIVVKLLLYLNFKLSGNPEDFHKDPEDIVSDVVDVKDLCDIGVRSKFINSELLESLRNEILARLSYKSTVGFMHCKKK
ncbi:unnamed protein product [Ambrosiozyma monospora]|uniref:Unnamed protein product n=1 Tax=Ambrosiozyma monospora TaxID=43982 RepID=A0ACB5TV53_AMBMO|nr:unnamed protein product [Ambrosiozyma monospora]